MSEPFAAEPQVSSLRELVDLREVQRLQDALAGSSRASLALTGPEGYALTRPSNFSPLCRQVRKTEKGRKSCLKSERALLQASKDLEAPTVWTCQSAGLELVCLPIRVQERHLANWVLGQVCPPEMDDSHLQRYSQSIQADPERMLGAFRSMPCLQQEDLLGLAKVLQRLSRFFIAAGFERLRLSAAMAGLERSVWELKGYQEHLENRVEEYSSELQERERVIQELSVTDSLTGCYNRKYLLRQLQDEMIRARRYGRVLSLSMASLNNLERINERLSEPAGDKALQELVKVLRGGIRGGTDWLARSEGSRFVLVFPETDRDEAHKVLERLRAKTGRSRVLYHDQPVDISASFGLCTWHPDGSSGSLPAEVLMACARTNLDRAREDGSGGIVSSFCSQTRSP